MHGRSGVISHAKIQGQFTKAPMTKIKCLDLHALNRLLSTAALQ